MTMFELVVCMDLNYSYMYNVCTYFNCECQETGKFCKMYKKFHYFVDTSALASDPPSPTVCRCPLLVEFPADVLFTLHQFITFFQSGVEEDSPPSFWLLGNS